MRLRGTRNSPSTSLTSMTRSLKLDLVILMKTIISTVKRDGITAIGEVTMSEFMGPRDTGEETE